MMNDNPYFNGSSTVMPAGYAITPTEPQNAATGGRKKIIIGIIIFLVIIIGAIVTAIILGNNSGSKFGEDAERLEYDIGDADTGGEAAETPINQSLDFLLQYQISESDINLVQSNILTALNQYYASTGYDTIIYDISSAELSKNKDSLSFIFVTDRKDMHFRATLALSDGRVSAVTIVPSDPLQ